MTAEELRDLYRYSDWATARLLAAVRALPPAAALHELPGSFTTLRALLAHVAGAEWVWLERFRGESPTAVPEWFESPEAETLAARLEEIAALRRELLRGLADLDLEDRLAFRYFNGSRGSISLGDALFHVVNHATYHRGQLATMLRALGATPPATDFTVYRTETRG